MEENEEQQAQAEPQEPHGDGTDWKAEARKWEKRAKENRESAEELKQVSERLAAAEAALEAEKNSRKLETVRAKVAKETGVPAEFVVGETEAQMRSFAEKLSEHYKAPAAPAIVERSSKFGRAFNSMMHCRNRGSGSRRGPLTLLMGIRISTPKSMESSTSSKVPRSRRVNRSRVGNWPSLKAT